MSGGASETWTCGYSGNHEIEQQDDANNTIFASVQARWKVRHWNWGKAQSYINQCFWSVPPQDVQNKQWLLADSVHKQSGTCFSRRKHMNCFQTSKSSWHLEWICRSLRVLPTPPTFSTPRSMAQFMPSSSLYMSTIPQVRISPKILCQSHHLRLIYAQTSERFSASEYGTEAVILWFKLAVVQMYRPNPSISIFFPQSHVCVGSDQWNFLSADLLSVNRTATPWIIVNFHNPWVIFALALFQTSNSLYISPALICQTGSGWHIRETVLTDVV